MKHRKVKDCLHGGKCSKYCSCYHCTLAVCSVCGAYEGGLTTDCPGYKVHAKTSSKVYHTDYDYTDLRGWHNSGVLMKDRHPQFELPTGESQ